MSREDFFRDYSSNTHADYTPESFHKVHQIFFEQDQENYLKALSYFSKSSWFAENMRPFVKFLDFAITNYQGVTLNALIYAFSHAGTANSLVNLCQGLFGLDSTVLLTPSKATVGIEVKNANTDFFKGWVDAFTNNKAIVSTSKKWIILEDFSKLAGNNLIGLIKEFIPCGWKIDFKIKID